MSHIPPRLPSDDEVADFCKAARDGEADTVTALLDKYGADIIEQKYGNTALMLAVWHDRGHILSLLVERGADINASSGTDQQTPLMWAAMKGQHKAVALLLEKGACPDKKDQEGKTAEMIAQREGYPDIIRMIQEGREMQSKRRLRLQRQKDQEDDRATRQQTAAQLEALKKQRPAKTLLKKNPPFRP